MEPFVIIRNYRPDDELKCQELIRDYVMNFCTQSFYSFCFREITLQFIVLTWALLFIFVGVPLTFCALTIPGCIFFLFIATYLSFYAKAVELMQIKPNQAIVVECFEPLLFRSKPEETAYQIYTDKSPLPFEPSHMNKFRKKIIATVSVKNHNSIYNAAWIYRFAVQTPYFHKVVGPMIERMIDTCRNNGYGTLECTISEWQEKERDFFDKLNFVTRQIYHKQIIGSTLTVMKSQLTYKLSTDIEIHKQN